MQPYNVKTTKKDLIKRLEIRDYPDKDAQKAMIRDYYGPEERSPNFYDPAKLTYNQKLRIQKTEVLDKIPREPSPTQAEIQAERVLDFAHYIDYNLPREKRWRNQK